jgi:hypothetical protein
MVRAREKALRIWKADYQSWEKTRQEKLAEWQDNCSPITAATEAAYAETLTQYAPVYAAKQAELRQVWEKAHAAYELTLADYNHALHAYQTAYSEAVRKTYSDFWNAQKREPKNVPFTSGSYTFHTWVFRDLVLSVEDVAPDDDVSLAIKRFVLRRERHRDQMKHEVAAYENMANGTTREPIAEAVRQAVWTRDRGKCRRCGSNRGIEYDHVIPVSRGGSSGVNNIQILCMPCNRAKGASI